MSNDVIEDFTDIIAVQIGYSVRGVTPVYRIFKNGKDITYSFSKKNKWVCTNNGITTNKPLPPEIPVWFLSDLKMDKVLDKGKK